MSDIELGEKVMKLTKVYLVSNLSTKTAFGTSKANEE